MIYFEARVLLRFSLVYYKSVDSFLVEFVVAERNNDYYTKCYCVINKYIYIYLGTNGGSVFALRVKLKMCINLNKSRYLTHER